jgi:NO-binding membrane sensor protein with MHYT domain
VNEVITTTYDLNYLALSFIISVLGSYVGLLAYGNILNKSGQVQYVHVLSAALGIGGVGVWSMHFIGMLALKLDIPYGYAMLETLISLVSVIVVAAAALVHVAKAPKQTSRLLQAGIGLGLGVCVMHYLGMFGMRFGGFFAWNWSLVAASVLVAIVAATAALWLASYTKGSAMRVVAALVMGSAVCAMHYTGMAAASFICSTPTQTAVPKGWDVVASIHLPQLVILLSFGLILIIFCDQLYYSFNRKSKH